MCSDLISAAVLYMVLSKGEAFVSCSVGVLISRLSTADNHVIAYIRKEDLFIILKWFKFERNGENEINTILVSLSMSNTHRGVLIRKKGS